MSLMGKKKEHSLVKVVFYLGRDQWHGFETESVWAERISDNLCRIRNSPFYASGVSFEDVVFVKEQGGLLVFEAVSTASGHSTYRILVEKSVTKAEFEKYWLPLEKLGCSYESADSGRMSLLAVDVPPSVDVYKAYELFTLGEQSGVWGFEEGHCGHLV